MRAVQIAVLFLCIQVGMALVNVTGLFTEGFYEGKEMLEKQWGSPSALSPEEQEQVSIDVMNELWKGLTWGWISNYFQPFYNKDVGVKAVVDKFIWGLNGISAFAIGIAFIEFIRNRLNVLGG